MSETKTKIQEDDNEIFPYIVVGKNHQNHPLQHPNFKNPHSLTYINVKHAQFVLQTPSHVFLFPQKDKCAYI